MTSYTVYNHIIICIFFFFNPGFSFYFFIYILSIKSIENHRYVVTGQPKITLFKVEINEHQNICVYLCYNRVVDISTEEKRMFENEQL